MREVSSEPGAPALPGPLPCASPDTWPLHLPGLSPREGAPSPTTQHGQTWGQTREPLAVVPSERVAVRCRPNVPDGLGRSDPSCTEAF